MPNGRVYPDTLSQPTSLEELLNSVNYTQPPVETPAPPQPSQVFTEGVMTPQDRQQLVDKFLSTPDYGPEPKVDKPNLLAQILTGAGDSLTTYASILGNAPDAKTHTLATYMQYLANQKASKEKYDRRKAEGQSEAQTRKLNYILSADDRARELFDKRAEAELARTEVATYKAAQLKQEGEIAAAKSASEQADRETRIAIETMGNANRLDVANAERRLHGDRVKGEGDKAQHSVYVQLKGAIVAKKREYSQLLADGKITPEEIQSEWQDIRAAVDLDPNGPYAAAADAFFKDQINPVMMKYAQPQGPQADPNPSQDASGYILQQGLAPVVGGLKRAIRPFGRGGKSEAPR